MKKSQKSEKRTGNVEVPANNAALCRDAATLTNREVFLAAHPDLRELQEETIEVIRKRLAEFRPRFRGIILEQVELCELGRQIGLAVLELEDQLPGKRLTEDFWRQLPELFTDSQGQKVSREMLEWFAKIARNFPEPITEIAEARKAWQPLLLASGEEAFQLESQRGVQLLHDKPSPVSVLREQFNFSKISNTWADLKADPNYFPGGHLRPDLRETLIVELEPTIRIVEELKRELGL